MIEEKEKELNSNQSLTISNNQNLVENKVKMETDFSKRMDEVKQNILTEASVEDKRFVETVKENVKKAAEKLTEVEKKKAEYQEQQVDYESEKLDTQQKKNVHEQNEDKWINKQKRREFHYNGVKPIMTFVGINDPMNLGFLYILAIILAPMFLLSKFIKGTFGTLIAGASDGNRTKAAKGFLWTIVCVFALLVVICLVLLFLKWQGIDVFANIKNLKGGN